MKKWKVERLLGEPLKSYSDSKNVTFLKKFEKGLGNPEWKIEIFLLLGKSEENMKSVC
jgi:hypothetical protein